MAYENQIKCKSCSISIPPMPEDATVEELLCDTCLKELEEEAGGDETSLGFAIDIPNSNIIPDVTPESPWINMGYFDSWQEALKYAKEYFGADDEGRICIISKMPED